MINKYYYNKMNNRWKKDFIEEYMTILEKELEEFRSYEENEQREFENNVYYNSGITEDFIYEKSIETRIHDILNGMDTSNVSLKYKFQEKSQFFNFQEVRFSTKTMNFMTDIYLEVVMPELSEKHKFSLLSTMVSFNGFNGNTIENNSMVACIFKQICSGRNIKQNNNILQIPIFNFDTFKTGNCTGLPVNKYNDAYIIRLVHTSGYEYLKEFEFNIIVNGTITAFSEKGTSMRCQSMKDIKNNNFMILTGDGSYWNLSRPYYDELFSGKYIINSSCLKIVKCILLCYIPDFQCDEPEINSVSLISDNKEIISFDVSELLDFNIFDIKIYCMPLCKEFSDWDEIDRLFKNNHKNISSDGIEFSKLGKDTKLQINYDKASQIGHKLIYCKIGFRECVIDDYMFNIK